MGWAATKAPCGNPEGLQALQATHLQALQATDLGFTAAGAIQESGSSFCTQAISISILNLITAFLCLRAFSVAWAHVWAFRDTGLDTKPCTYFFHKKPNTLHTLNPAP